MTQYLTDVQSDADALAQLDAYNLAANHDAKASQHFVDVMQGWKVADAKHRAHFLATGKLFDPDA
jgi:hypothetical protein